MDTYLHIDYLSLSLNSILLSPVERPETMTIDEFYQAKVRSALQAYPSFVHHNFNGVHWDGEGGAGFKRRHHFETDGWTFFYGASHPRMLIQLAGQACHSLRRETDRDGNSIGLKPLFLIPDVRMTRIDIAGNWRTDMSPDVAAGFFSKKKASDYPRIPSETGLTQYINSAKSEVHAAIYRYFPPHPRSDWLRIEFRLSGEVARNAQEKIPSVGLLPIYKGLMSNWGWSNSVMISELGDGVEQQRLAYQKRKQAGSLKWLYEVAIPAVQRAIKKGDYSLDEFIEGIETIDD